MNITNQFNPSDFFIFFLLSFSFIFSDFCDICLSSNMPAKKREFVIILIDLKIVILPFMWQNIHFSEILIHSDK